VTGVQTCALPISIAKRRVAVKVIFSCKLFIPVVTYCYFLVIYEARCVYWWVICFHRFVSRIPLTDSKSDCAWRMYNASDARRNLYLWPRPMGKVDSSVAIVRITTLWSPRFNIHYWKWQVCQHVVDMVQQSLLLYIKFDVHRKHCQFHVHGVAYCSWYSI